MGRRVLHVTFSDRWPHATFAHQYPAVSLDYRRQNARYMRQVLGHLGTHGIDGAKSIYDRANDDPRAHSASRELQACLARLVAGDPSALRELGRMTRDSGRHDVERWPQFRVEVRPDDHQPRLRRMMDSLAAQYRLSQSGSQGLVTLKANVGP